MWINDLVQMKSTLLFKDLFSFQVVFDKESHVRSWEKFLYTFSWFPSKLYPTSLRILAYIQMAVKTLVSYKRAWFTSRIASRTKDYFYHKFRCTSFLTYREQLWNWHLEQHVFNQRKYLLIASNNHNLGRFESLVNLKKRQNKTTKSRPKNNTLNWWQTGRNSCPLLEESILKSKTSFLHYFC